MPLGKLQVEINLAINCATERPDAKDSERKRMIGEFEAIDGPTPPVIFQQSAK